MTPGVRISELKTLRQGILKILHYRFRPVEETAQQVWAQLVLIHDEKVLDELLGHSLDAVAINDFRRRLAQYVTTLQPETLETVISQINDNAPSDRLTVA